VTENRALIGILLFSGATKSSKENTSSIRVKDGTGNNIFITVMSQKRFLFLVYFLRFNDSTTRNQRRADDKLAPIRNIYDKFVVACEANYLQELVAQFMKLYTDSEECVVSSNTHQINRVNTASMYMFWLIAKPSSWFLPIFTRELALMHRDCQSQPKLFSIWFSQFREGTESLPLTIITC